MIPIRDRILAVDKGLTERLALTSSATSGTEAHIQIVRDIPRLGRQIWRYGFEGDR